jgi:cysteinyl-tRNA synthetase
MSKKYLGEQIDIHGGGEDLIFPHHENEIAQSEACSGKEFSTYWMHNAFLNINNHKMSKSAGNFFTVRDITEKYDPMVLRLFMLSAHYRSPLNFSDELMESAKAGYERIVNCVSNIEFLLKGDRSEGISDEEKALLESMKSYQTKMEKVMDDDFNTADAISCIFELVREANSAVSESSGRQFLEAVLAEIRTMTDICGLITERSDEIGDADIEALIEERQAARKARNFARADEIRDELLAKGIILEDTREGVKWKKA